MWYCYKFHLQELLPTSLPICQNAKWVQSKEGVFSVSSSKYGGAALTCLKQVHVPLHRFNLPSDSCRSAGFWRILRTLHAETDQCGFVSNPRLTRIYLRCLIRAARMVILPFETGVLFCTGLRLCCVPLQGRSCKVGVTCTQQAANFTCLDGSRPPRTELQAAAYFGPIQNLHL